MAASNIGMPLDGAEVVEANATRSPHLNWSAKTHWARGWFFRFKPADAEAIHHLLDQDLRAPDRNPPKPETPLRIQL